MRIDLSLENLKLSLAFLFLGFHHFFHEPSEILHHTVEMAGQIGNLIIAFYRQLTAEIPLLYMIHGHRQVCDSSCDLAADEKST